MLLMLPRSDHYFFLGDDPYSQRFTPTDYTGEVVLSPINFDCAHDYIATREELCSLSETWQNYKRVCISKHNGQVGCMCML